MSDADKLQDGDLVNVTYQTRVGSEAYRLTLLNQVSVELVERAWSVDKQPIGTVVRRAPYVPFVKIGKDKWASVGGPQAARSTSELLALLGVVGPEHVTGAVPDTPAAEKVAAGELSREQGDEERKVRYFRHENVSGTWRVKPGAVVEYKNRDVWGESGFKSVRDMLDEGCYEVPEP